MESPLFPRPQAITLHRGLYMTITPLFGLAPATASPHNPADDFGSFPDYWTADRKEHGAISHRPADRQEDKAEPGRSRRPRQSKLSDQKYRRGHDRCSTQNRPDL